MRKEAVGACLWCCSGMCVGGGIGLDEDRRDPKSVYSVSWFWKVGTFMKTTYIEVEL
jgi:hypothetical protein